jgi:hypothetical protein
VTEDQHVAKNKGQFKQIKQFQPNIRIIHPYFKTAFGKFFFKTYIPKSQRNDASSNVHSRNLPKAVKLVKLPFKSGKTPHFSSNLRLNNSLSTARRVVWGLRMAGKLLNLTALENCRGRKKNAFVIQLESRTRPFKKVQSPIKKC